MECLRFVMIRDMEKCRFCDSTNLNIDHQGSWAPLTCNDCDGKDYSIIVGDVDKSW